MEVGSGPVLQAGSFRLKEGPMDGSYMNLALKNGRTKVLDSGISFPILREACWLLVPQSIESHPTESVKNYTTTHHLQFSWIVREDFGWMLTPHSSSLHMRTTLCGCCVRLHRKTACPQTPFISMRYRRQRVASLLGTNTDFLSICRTRKRMSRNFIFSPVKK